MNTFTIYPALDLRAGRVVRLKEGDPGRQTIYSETPGEIARRWLAAGARWLHVVNLDGALDERDARNEMALRSILRITGSVQAWVQFGGGVRSLGRLEQVIELGVSRVVLGTLAIEQPEFVSEAVQKFGASKIAVGIDTRDGLVRSHGWKSNSENSAVDLALQMRNYGVRTIIFTDISRDGVGSGLNITDSRELAAIGGMDVIASGGVHTLDDITAARDAQLAGVIIGRALYEGTVDLKVALESTAEDLGHIPTTDRSTGASQTNHPLP